MDPGEKKSEIRKIIFDTDVLIWYFRGNEEAKAFLARFPFESRTLPSPVLMELFQGCSNKAELKTVKKFVDENFYQVIHPNEEISERAISLMEKYGLSHGLGTLDALIAATSLTLGHRLATANIKHYRFIKDLKIIPFKKRNSDAGIKRRL